MVRLDEEVKRASRFGRPLGLLVVSWATQVEFPEYAQWTRKGCGTLRQLAKLLKDSLRAIDVGGRVDGQLLAALLPETNLIGTRVVADRFCQDAARHEFMGESMEDVVLLSVSAGFSAFPEHSDDAEELLSMARQALELSQGAGYNLAFQAEKPG